ncbi:MAG TPA: hypothetical protein VJ623_08215 [Holophagaceae bacterium]|nr:hypothetical protein [Holophagaceae bacterium]
MTLRPFYTRSARLAFLRELVIAQADLSYSREDVKRVFGAVDAHCQTHFPGEPRGGWVSPIMLGGAGLNHTPSHLMFAAYAIYADLAWGQAPPVPYLGGPLGRGATAVQFGPGEAFRLWDPDGVGVPLTDLLLVCPTRASGEWIADAFGTPPLAPGVVAVGWHAAAESRFTAMAGGILLLHGASGQALDPLVDPTPAEAECFFQSPPVPERMARHRERLAESMGVPAEIRLRNSRTILDVLERYAEVFGRALGVKG